MRRRTYGGLLLSTALAGCSRFTTQEEDSSKKPYSSEDGTQLAVTRTVPTEECTFGDGTPLMSKRGRLLLIQLAAENTANTKTQLPTPAQFSIEVRDEARDPYQISLKDDPNGLASSISEPVSGPLFPGKSELSGDGSTTGWLIFSVPSESSETTLQLRDPEDAILHEWSLSFKTTA